MRRTVAIIGGGISGLAAAHRLREIAPQVDVTLFEAGSRVGGVIQTVREDGFLIESASDNFISTPPTAIQLCQRLGLEDDLICTRPVGRRAMVAFRGRLEPIPAGFLIMAPSRLWSMVTTPVLSVKGKLRAACECVIPRNRTDDDESLQSFVCRRFGKELFDRIVQPLVGGIYTADPEKLSLAATMPRFIEMERQHGSLIRAMLKQRLSKRKQPESSGGARYSQFMTLRGGMTSLVDKLASRLPEDSIQLNAPVCSLAPNGTAWSLGRTTGDASWMDADGVIVATPARHASQILATVDHGVSETLREIQAASCAVVSLAFRRDQIQDPLDSFGFVVPHIENRLILSCSFSSLKYEGRAPEGTVLMRVFIGGALQSGLLRLTNQELIELAHLEVAKFLGIEGEPLIRRITRYASAMPQYHVGHLSRVATIQRQLARFPTLALAGSSLSGVGVPACIQSGEKAAEQVAGALGASSEQQPQELVPLQSTADT